MPRIRKPSDMAEPFGLRLSAPALRACDELADVWEVNRQEALRRIVEAGLAACGRSGGAPSGSPLDRAQTSETWGHSLARSAALAASEAARDAVLRVAREFEDAFTLAKADDVEEPERRAPDSKPVPGGHRKAPPADPPERRETSRRLTDADVGRWVREDRGSNRHAHKLTRLGGGGTGDTACGKGVNLRYAERLDGPRGGADGAGRYCRKCRAL
jgi:hypothetical protein